MNYRVLYLAGTGRSGSTLVARYLNDLSSGVHVGELRYLWQRGVLENELCECGVPFDRCEFWTPTLAEAYGHELKAVAEELRALSPSVDRIRRVPQALTRTGTRYRQRIRRYGELVRPLYDTIARVTGTDVVIDSSKDPSYLYLLAALEGLRVEPVHLVRDPRAVAYSWTRSRRRPEIHWAEQYMRTIRPRRAALIWLEYNTAIELFMARHRSSARLRYEDFAAAPDKTIRDACRAARVSTAATGDNAATGHSVSGNPVRFQRGPLVVRPDNEWEEALPVKAQRTVTALTLPLLARYGYRVNVRKTPKCA